MKIEMVKIPEGWIETTLGEISLKKQYGYTESASTKEIGPKFLRITDIQNDFIDWENVPFCSILQSEYGKYKLKIGDIVIARTGNSTGATAVIKEDVNAVFASYLIRFVLNPEMADYNYIDFLLRSNIWTNFVKSIKTGSAQGGANANSFALFPILLPPLPEQKAIAGVLSAFDDKIELLRAENQTLEDMGQTLFKERFGKYKVGDELPDGWKWGELGEIGDQITERVKNEKERVVLSAVNSGNLVLSESYFSKQVFSEDIAKYIICNKGDFAYNPARINIGSIGRNFYWNGAVSPVYVVFRPKEKFGKYLEFIFKSERFKNHVEKYANGSVRQALNYDGFSRFELLIPNNDILEKFNENLEVFEKKIEENKKQIETLSNTRDQLLPKLMSGEVRVKF